jgi:hypothetical protein
VVILLLSGCSSTGAGSVTDPPAPTPSPQAWPDDWGTLICAAISDTTDAVTTLGSAFTDASNYDFTSAKKEADDAASKAKDGLSSLDAAPTWAPGRSLVSYLSAALTRIQRTGGLASIAIANNDVSAVNAADKQAASGAAEINRATTAAEALTAKYGFQC